MKLILLGRPMAKQSARFARRGNFMHKYQPKRLVNWIQDAKAQIREQLPDDWVPISSPVKILSISFQFPPLKSWSKKKLKSLQAGEIIFKETKPDMDNLLKNLWDACNGLVWIDDRQIVELLKASKTYNEVPRIVIEVGEK